MSNREKRSAIFILLLVIAFVIITQFACTTRKTTNSAKAKKVIIYPNETAAEVAGKLQDNGIISNTKIFLFWAKLLRYDKKIKPGRYYFAPNSRTLDILKKLNRGGESKALVTVPEGYNLKEIARLLENEGICSEKEFFKVCSDKAFLKSLQINNTNVEGYLFPDSYDFIFLSEPREVIERMVKRFFQIYNEIKNSKSSSAKATDTIVKIASLVEKEALLENERPIIASVFYNRLKYKMPLQSCATVQYILPNHKEVLSVEDTKIQSPYNTYLNPGLPPTPICSPGRASLMAAINPAQTKYLYFAVDKNSSHYFSKSFSEHQKFLRNKNSHR